MNEKLNLYRVRILFAALVLAWVCLPAAAQDKNSKQQPDAANGDPAEDRSSTNSSAGTSTFYHLDYVVKEVAQGKTTNTRQYVLNIASPHGNAAVRDDMRVPVEPSGGGTQYIDIGVNIDANIECYSGCRLTTNSNINFLLPSSAVAGSANTGSLTQHENLSGNIPLTLGKQLVVASADDPAGTRTVVLEVTITRVQ